MTSDAGFGPGPGFGPGRGFGPGPFGHRGPRPGRRRRGDVRTALLLLLAEEPRNGYGLMQLIEERSGGRWRPSPGSVYPALAQLEDEGLIRSVERDSGKVLELTDAGRQALEERGEQSPPWEPSEDNPAADAAIELRKLVFAIGGAAMQVVQAGDEGQVAKARETLSETRRALYRILADDGEQAGPPEPPTTGD